jgi:hypothetical protein
MKRFALALTLVAACGPLPTQQNAQAPGTAARKKVHCTEVTTTGSMMTRSMCRSQEDADDQRDATKNALSVPKQATPVPGAP